MRLLRRPGHILRLEGAVLLAATLSAYANNGLPWFWAPLIVFVPDIIFIERVRDNRWGERFYNLLHTYPLPSLLMFYAVVSDYMLHKPLTGFAILWFMHIGFDRLIGRGKRYDGAFIDHQHELARQLMGEPDKEHHDSLARDNRATRWGED